MLKSETAKLLAEIAELDRRNLNQLTVEAWHEMVGKISYADARKAVRQHYTKSTDRIMPADIIRRSAPDPNAWMARTERAPWQMTPEERLDKFGRAWDDETLQLARDSGLTEDHL